MGLFFINSHVTNEEEKFIFHDLLFQTSKNKKKIELVQSESMK